MGCQQSMSKLHSPIVQKRSRSQKPRKRVNPKKPRTGSKLNTIHIINPIYIPRGKQPSPSITLPQNDSSRFNKKNKPINKYIEKSKSTRRSWRRLSHLSQSNFTPEISTLSKNNIRPSISRLRSSETINEGHFKILKSPSISNKEIWKRKERKERLKTLDYNRLPSIFKPVRLCTFKK